MLFIDERPFASTAVQRVVSTRIDVETPISDGGVDLRAQIHEAWQTKLNTSLMTWLRDPSQLEDDGVEAPSKTILRVSLDLAEQLRDAGLPPPDSILPDPNGGIVFAKNCEEVQEVFHVWDDGTVEYQQFHGTKLVKRATL